jgi:hypothetical protein
MWNDIKLIVSSFTFSLCIILITPILWIFSKSEFTARVILKIQDYYERITDRINQLEIEIKQEEDSTKEM